jgi:hypothetical protein
MLQCEHAGPHSGEGRYAAEASEMRYVVVCDDCREEVREVVRMPYRPSFIADGRPAPDEPR